MFQTKTQMYILLNGNPDINMMNKTNSSTCQLKEGNFLYPFTFVTKYWLHSCHPSTQVTKYLVSPPSKLLRDFQATREADLR